MDIITQTSQPLYFNFNFVLQFQLKTLSKGPDPEWPITVSQPEVTIPGDNNGGIRYKVGVDWSWARQADQAVFDNFSKCIKSLPNVDIIDITVPELSMADISHLVIFAAEEVEDAANDVNPTADNVLLMNIFGANLKPTDFIRASRFRSRYMRIIKARNHKIRSLKKLKMIVLDP